MCIRDRFYRQRYAKANKEAEAPNICAAVDHFNHVTDWIKTLILSEADVKKRARVVERFIEVGMECLKLQNFDSMLAITSSLQSPPVDRLKKTWALLSEQHTQDADALKRYSDPRKNSANLRELIANSAPNKPALPFIGLVLADLIHSDEIPSKHEDDPTLIRWQRYKMIGRVLDAVPRYKRNSFASFKVDPEFVLNFNNMELFDKDEARLASRGLEARQQ